MLTNARQKQTLKSRTARHSTKTLNISNEHYYPMTALTHNANFLNIIHEQRLLTKIDKLNSQKLEKKKARPILLAQVLGVVHQRKHI